MLLDPGAELRTVDGSLKHAISADAALPCSA